MPRKKRRKASRDTTLVDIYEKVTCLEVLVADMKTKELETLTTEMYNAVKAPLNPKRIVLLNELLDMEVELRVRTNAETE